MPYCMLVSLDSYYLTLCSSFLKRIKDLYFHVVSKNTFSVIPPQFVRSLLMAVETYKIFLQQPLYQTPVHTQHYILLIMRRENNAAIDLPSFCSPLLWYADTQRVHSVTSTFYSAIFLTYGLAIPCEPSYIVITVIWKYSLKILESSCSIGTPSIDTFLQRTSFIRFYYSAISSCTSWY